jgi:Rrf2 family protein
MISKKTINAIEVCVYLASQSNAGYVTTTELSPRLDLSISYLENILKPLKDKSIVIAMKGPGGGYMIRGDMSLISMWDIASVFEPMFTELEDHACNQADIASPHDMPASYEMDLQRIVQDTLSQFTLSDFVDFTSPEVRSYVQEMGRFKFKPMAVPLMPRAPNSVFQLHMAF